MLSRNGKLDPIWTLAQNGNVALIGEIDFTQADEVTLALGFGQHPEEAAHRVRSSLNFGFARACNDYIAHWRDTLEQAAPLAPASPPDVRDCYRTSVAELRWVDSSENACCFRRFSARLVWAS